MKTVNYASFWERLIAAGVDSALVFLLWSCAIRVVVLQPDLSDAVFDFFLALVIMLNPVFILYPFITLYLFGGSLGKLITGLRIVQEDHSSLTFKRAFFRQTVGYSFSSLFLGLGYLAIVKDEKKQAWHDKTVKSIVIVKDSLWPAGLLFLIVLNILCVISLVQSFGIYAKGPLGAESQVLLQQSLESVHKSSYFPGHPVPTAAPSNVDQ